jgi:hypothetical protein
MRRQPRCARWRWARLYRREGDAQFTCAEQQSGGKKDGRKREELAGKANVTQELASLR